MPSLAALVEDSRFEVALVVSQPDRRAGRGRRVTPPPVAAFAAEADLPLFRPGSLRDDDAFGILEAARPDLLVVVAYGEILRRNVLQLAPGGALNVHPSLLPKYRGASPLPEAIRQGDSQTGVSIMKLVRRLDAGPVIAQTAMDIEDGDTTGTLGDRLAVQAAEILPDVCDAWLRGEAMATEQDDSTATYTYEWTKSDAEIDWSLPAVEIERLVRAALPWPVAWTLANGQRLQVRVATVLPGTDGDPGELVEHGRRVTIATGTGHLELLSVQPQGKREMPATGWWNGLQDKPRFLGT